MVRTHPENPEIRRLIQDSAAARACMGQEIEVLKQRLDIPARIRGSLKEHPGTWLFSGLGAGLVASLLFRRQPPVSKKHRSFPATMLGLTLTAVRPMVKIWLANQVKDWLKSSSLSSQISRLGTRSNPPSNSF